jgi:hypothetical protein
VTVFQDADLYRMYYGCYPFGTKSPDQYTGYAESSDGIHWTRPVLNLVDFKGSRENNLLWEGPKAHNFSPFIDTQPDVAPDQRYKAVTGDPPLALASADGIHWRKLQETPILQSDNPAFERLGIAYWGKDPSSGRALFDSHNLAFWDSRIGEYVYYFRGWTAVPDLPGVRIRTFFRSRSQDFLRWSEPEAVEFSTPPTLLDQFYTNCVQPYFRAPHIYVALPMRLAWRKPLSQAADRDGLGEAVLMVSRDGLHFHRYMEAFLRPGLDQRDWSKHSNMMAWGMLSLSPGEISLYHTRHHYAPTAHLQRTVLRADGFVSLQAPYSGGEFTTRPLLFFGNRLEINVSTGAAGSLRVEIQDESGRPIEGFGLHESREFYGDEIEYIAQWRGGADVGRLAGRPVRLRFVLQDADVFSLRFLE